LTAAGLYVPAAYYSARVADFLEASPEAVIGALAIRSGSVEALQRDAWIGQIGILKTALALCSGSIFLEFDVPRVGSRIDAVLISGPTIVVIEFKVGESSFLLRDRNQVWDYALDLKNFHAGSHAAPIVPILVATEGAAAEPTLMDPAGDGVFPPLMCSAARLGDAIQLALRETAGPPLDADAWARAPYLPTPTIVEAAQALYASHSVDAIARHDAGAQNLSLTSGRVEAIIDDARRERRKAIVFVTGVPGAGKTLVGLDVATRRRDEHSPTHAVFLSGNGPLVKVLTEALARDEVARRRRQGDRTRKGEIVQRIKAFIQNVHHFRDAGLRDETAPADRVVIFDEAQRAWNRAMTADFMRRKKGRPGFDQSEPEFLLSYLDRHDDWAVVICLVGGGQEINRGEAGIAEWLDAASRRFRHWTTYVSPNLVDSEYAAAGAIRELGTAATVISDEALHLAVSMRSFRAEHVSRFVKAVLDRDRDEARTLLDAFRARYPIALTRDLDRARRWILAQARGSERFGLVASSGAQRLKPHAVDVRVTIDPVHWFLNDREDTRSSYYLEDAATEFQVQGLELDWACVTWDADLRAVADGWTYHAFVSSRWQHVKKPDRQQYLRNAYRVLLTRARQGMVIFVPPGDADDPTRPPAVYDRTFQYLHDIGLPTI
jgi:hypothetical protein